MIWLKLSEDMAHQLLQLCEEHRPELGEELLQELDRFQGDPEQPWQDQKAAVDFSRSRWSHEQDDIEIDDNAALSAAENGVWVQGWLWVDREELEGVITGEVQDQ